MNIVLCGMMGVGKTSVGRRLAELSGRCWYDTDDLIAEKYGKISDIFEFYGEEYFRSIETETIGEVTKEDNLVISTGGGAVMRFDNVKLFKENGCQMVYLRATPDSLMKRLSPDDDSRPLLAKRSEEGMKRRIEELLASRSHIYEHVADYIVDTDDKGIDEIAAEILQYAAGTEQGQA